MIKERYLVMAIGGLIAANAGVITYLVHGLWKILPLVVTGFLFLIVVVATAEEGGGA